MRRTAAVGFLPRRAICWRLAVRYHTELFFTTRLQKNVDLRAGLCWLPLLYLPLAAEPMVMGVWRF